MDTQALALWLTGLGFEAEVARRSRLHAAGHDVPDPNADDYLAWRDLAREVRERADIVLLLMEAGCALQREDEA